MNRQWDEAYRTRGPVTESVREIGNVKLSQGFKSLDFILRSMGTTEQEKPLLC